MDPFCSDIKLGFEILTVTLTVTSKRSRWSGVDFQREKSSYIVLLVLNRFTRGDNKYPDTEYELRPEMWQQQRYSTTWQPHRWTQARLTQYKSYKAMSGQIFWLEHARHIKSFNCRYRWCKSEAELNVAATRFTSSVCYVRYQDGESLLFFWANSVYWPNLKNNNVAWYKFVQNWRTIKNITVLFGIRRPSVSKNSQHSPALASTKCITCWMWYGSCASTRSRTILRTI